MTIRNRFPDSKDDGEVIAAWGRGETGQALGRQARTEGRDLKEDAALSTISGSSVLFVLIAFTRSHHP